MKQSLDSFIVLPHWLNQSSETMYKGRIRYHTYMSLNLRDSKISRPRLPGGSGTPITPLGYYLEECPDEGGSISSCLP